MSNLTQGITHKYIR